MKKINMALTGTALAVAISASAFAAEPTRGFVIEHATIAEEGSVSADINSDLNRAGIRVGLGVGELVINSGKVGIGQIVVVDDSTGDVEVFGATSSDAFFKFGLGSIDALSEIKNDLAVYGGLSYLDAEGAGKYTNLMAGAAFTGEIEQLSFTVAADLVIDDMIDETYVDISAGGYFNLGETKYGTFKPGAELVVSTLSGKDAEIYFGMKWGIKENVNLDVVPLSFGNGDVKSLPGLIRLNVHF